MPNRIEQIIAQLRANGATEAQIQQWRQTNGINTNVPVPVSNFASTGNGMLGRIFSNLGSRIGPGKSLLNGNFDMGKITQLPGNIRATNLWEGGPTVAQGANTINALYQGGTALKGLYDNLNSDTDLKSLKDDIKLERASNPMYDTYLDAADEKLIRQVNNGSVTNNWGGAMSEAVQGIPKAALSAALGYLTGGVGGAAIGGIGSLVNSGISGYSKENDQASAKLQGLYDKLRRAGEDYRTMKRPAGIRQAGLSNQYFNQLY